MAAITQHYRISGPVPFCDIDIANDNRLFIDACAIRMTAGVEPYRPEAIRCLETFFGEIARAVMSPHANDHVYGRELLQRFAEPRETRFGLAAKGFRGHGGGDDVGSAIWDALVSDLVALMGVGVLSRVEHLPLFVSGVGDDITSDITTRLILSVLARFTLEMTKQYPEFSAGGNVVQHVERQVWDPERLNWRLESMAMPVVNGEPLLLVPREWARPHLLMSSELFYQKTVLDFVQQERVTILGSGRIHKPSKKELRAEPAIGRRVPTNRSVSLRALDTDVSLTEKFEAHVRTRLHEEGRSLAA